MDENGNISATSETMESQITEQNNTAPKENGKQQNNDLDRMVQSAVDRATHKLGTENKSLREQLETLQRQNMTEAEKYEADIKKREADVTARELALKTEKNRMYAITAIKNANLDDGGTTALELVDIVMADDEKGIDTKVKTLGTLVNKLVQAEVNKTFREYGRNPSKGDNGSVGDTKNLTAKEIGRKSAEVKKNSQNIINSYIGGKK